jgi:TetR/AcrR family transcriptional repressor of nem operon
VKVTRQKAGENRADLLTAAARLFRERGIAGVGVDALTDAAGLTYGSLYSQFGSKDNLAAEALRAGYAKAEERSAGVGSLDEFLDQYLSLQHRNAPGAGCFMAALGSEMPRQSDAVRKTFTAIVKANIARIGGFLRKSRDGSEDRAIFAVSAMVGALILSRAIDDPALADRILAVASGRLRDDHPGAGRPGAGRPSIGGLD